MIISKGGVIVNKNDIIVDQKNGIGIVTEVKDEKISVTFDGSIQYIYNIYNNQLNVIDAAFINYINNLYSELYIENYQTINEQEIRIHDFSYTNNCFSANLTTHYTARAFVFKDSTKPFRCTCSLKNKCSHVMYLVKYLHNKFIRFTKFEESQDNTSIYQMTLNFCYNFLDLELFNNLSNIYKNLSLDQTIDYCELVSELGVSESIISFIIMMVAHNTPYLQELYEHFSLSKKSIIDITLNWVVNRSNYAKEKNYLIYRAVVLLSNNQMTEWIEDVINKNKAYLLFNRNHIFNRIFIEIIKKTNDISALYDLNSLNYDESLGEYYEYLYIYSSVENRKLLLDNKKITKITSAMIPYLSIKELLDNFELIEKFLERRVIDLHLAEMLKIDPILTINKIIRPNKYIYASTFENIKRCASYLPDNKYILKFIDSMMNINRTENIDTIDEIQKAKEGEKNDDSYE